MYSGISGEYMTRIRIPKISFDLCVSLRSSPDSFETFTLAYTFISRNFEFHTCKAGGEGKGEGEGEGNSTMLIYWVNVVYFPPNEFHYRKLHFPKNIFRGIFFFFFFFKFEIRKEIRFAFCFSTGNYGRVAKPEDEFSLFPDYVNKCMISEKYRYK